MDDFVYIFAIGILSICLVAMTIYAIAMGRICNRSFETIESLMDSKYGDDDDDDSA